MAKRAVQDRQQRILGSSESTRISEAAQGSGTSVVGNEVKTLAEPTDGYELLVQRGLDAMAVHNTSGCREARFCLVFEAWGDASVNCVTRLVLSRMKAFQTGETTRFRRVRETK